jgi:formylglycine-generating enzyme
MKQLNCTLKKILSLAGIMAMAAGGTFVLAAQPGKTTPAPAVLVPLSDMVLIEGATFVMGSDSGRTVEKPAHSVTISRFYMDKTEVTQEDYERVMGNNPSLFKGCPKCPVEQVSWQDASDYCAKIKKGLPTEAQWEYACRAQGSTAYYWGDTMNDAYAWYSDNAGRKTHPVGQKKPNAFGLYDMSGNVYEWCNDWFDENYYSKTPTQNPKGPREGQSRVFRGGSWNNNRDGVGSAMRGWDKPDAYVNNVGFRCAK